MGHVFWCFVTDRATRHMWDYPDSQPKDRQFFHVFEYEYAYAGEAESYLTS